VVVRQVRRHGIDRDTVAELRRQFDAMTLSQSGRDTAEAMISVIAEQAWVARIGGERLIAARRFWNRSSAIGRPCRTNNPKSGGDRGGPFC
jgi:hypothetical protein